MAAAVAPTTPTYSHPPLKMKNPLPLWSVAAAAVITPMTPADASGVMAPSVSRVPVPISVAAATRAWTAAGWRPSDSKYLVVPSRPPGPRTLFSPCTTIIGPMVSRRMRAATSDPERSVSDLVMAGSLVVVGSGSGLVVRVWIAR